MGIRQDSLGILLNVRVTLTLEAKSQKKES